MLKLLTLGVLCVVSSLNVLAAEDVNSFQDPTVKYSVDFNWENNEINPEQKYIFPCSDNKELNDRFLNKVKKWSDLNPHEGGATINIWYDSKKSTQEAIDATKKELDGYPIILKDTRNLQLVKDNPDIFSEQTPVYFRTDLLRAIFTKQQVESGSVNCSIFAQFNMTPLSKAELFDKQTLEDLKKYGLVLAFNTTGTNSSGDSNTESFENGFFMYSANEYMKEALEKILINGSMRSMSDLLIHEEKRCLIPSMNQAVYFNYLKAYQSFYFIKILYSESKDSYTKEHLESWYSQIPLTDFRKTGSLECFKTFKFKKYRRNGKLIIPTKKITCPTSKLRYDSQGKGNDPENF